MFKKICIIFPVICVILCLISVIRGYAEETLTITTYYPSPYGSYYELRAYKLAVGNPNDALFGERFVNFADQMGLGEIVAAKAFNISGRYYATRIAEKVISADNRSGTDIMSDLSVNILLDADANNSDTASFRILNATADSSDSSKELFRVNATGNVGIGTASPGVKLHIQRDNPGDATPDYTLVKSYLNDGGNSTGINTGRMALGNSDTVNALINVFTKPVSNHQSEMQFQTRNTVGTLQTGLYINKDGNVGIGTTDPTSKLSIGRNGEAGWEYLKIDMESGTPPASECNEQPEGGRMIYDDSGHVIWVCDGAGGWKKVGGQATNRPVYQCPNRGRSDCGGCPARDISFSSTCSYWDDSGCNTTRTAACTLIGYLVAP